MKNFLSLKGEKRKKEEKNLTRKHVVKESIVMQNKGRDTVMRTHPPLPPLVPSAPATFLDHTHPMTTHPHDHAPHYRMYTSSKVLFPTETPLRKLLRALGPIVFQDSCKKINLLEHLIDSGTQVGYQ
jgi:hypothetical protein